jgi:hypothetical protein
MEERPLVFPERLIALTEILERTIEEVSCEQRVWVPAPVTRYMGHLLTEQGLTPIPSNLSRRLEHLHHQIPRNRLRRYDHLRKMGDLILYCAEYWGINSVVGTRAHAQNYYDDAAHLGKMLGEPRAAALEHIAAELDTYAPILRATCCRVHNS